MLNYSFLASNIVTPEGIKYNNYINISGSIIKSITESPLYNVRNDLKGKMAMPGFIDIHTHGYFGIDAMEANENDLHRWASLLARKGVTSFIPTCVSSPIDDIINFIEKIKSAMSSQGKNEAKILGARSEGPYISMEMHGAHNPEFLRKINVNEISMLADRYPLRIIDIAPELENFQAALSIFNNHGVIVSIGHSNADFPTSSMALNSNVRLMTHFYNAMTRFNYRIPGMIDAGLLSKDAFLEVIPDLHHVSPQAIKIMERIKGLNKIIAVTDSLSIGGVNDVTGSIGNLKIEKRENVAYISGTNTIAGSILSMDTALKNLYNLGFNINDISMALSSNQADLLGINTGKIRSGMIADINIIDDDLNVVKTIISGNIVD